MAKLQLPSILTEETWFYKDSPQDQARLKPFLNMPYISYSSVDSYFNYPEDFIKQKFAKIKLPDGIYGTFGTYCGTALEDGIFPENPHNFYGQENMNLEELRGKNSEFERMIIIDRGGYFIIGFIDRLTPTENGVHVRDQKTGGKDKEAKYKNSDYIQVTLYSHALELEGLNVTDTDVWFIRRVGSHVNPPLGISKEQFSIPIEYNKETVKYALDKVDRAVIEISELYKTYLKVFGEK